MRIPTKETVILVVGADEFGEAIGLLLEDEAAIVHHVEMDTGAYRSVHDRIRPHITVIDCVTDEEEGPAFLHWLRIDSRIPPHPVMLIVDVPPEAPPVVALRTAPIEYLETPISHYALVELYKRFSRAVAPTPPAPNPVPPRPVPPPRPEPPPPAPAPSVIPEARPALKRVVVVDDEPAHSALLKEFLEQGGYEAIECPGPQLFECALLKKPDLIVMDIRMPIIDGITLTGVLKFCHLTRHIPVVMLTAHSGGRFVEASKQARASAFIAKPVRVSDFLATIREVLARQ